ncbi:hypothetical protein DFA_10562 [Cavenderia fasciculata]|uniref:Uncharacterized protein n=1 Tax=Cavenderia fasciculata TaxID=261658 RepID=F4QAK1_CACFS|nr:uncharacterized protein DFA_10562 [Cavenderia fasciculata]EGG15720.1 hypothetical protein DFA_10562 [Cavenderia fasciculata]|eukprot:XP_004354462.1 hypothetical protein DFA_10562 [Cavenderia fasciculata]
MLLHFFYLYTTTMNKFILLKRLPLMVENQILMMLIGREETIIDKKYKTFNIALYNLAMVCKGWFDLVSSNITHASFYKNYSNSHQESCIESAVALILGQQSRQYSIIKQLLSATFQSRIHPDDEFSDRLLQSLIDRQEINIDKPSSSTLEHILYIDSRTDHKFALKLRNAIVANPQITSLHSVSIRSNFHTKQTSQSVPYNMTGTFIGWLRNFPNIKTIACYYRPSDHQRNEILHNASINTNVTKLLLDVGASITTQTLENIFRQESNVEYFKGSTTNTESAGRLASVVVSLAKKVVDLFFNNI